MDNVWSIMDLLFAGAGLYAIYAYYLLKTKGEITTSILMSKDVDIRKCKDIEGYKAFVAPKILIFGIAALLYGILSMRRLWFCFLRFWFGLHFRRGRVFRCFGD